MNSTIPSRYATKHSARMIGESVVAYAQSLSARSNSPRSWPRRTARRWLRTARITMQSGSARSITSGTLPSILGFPDGLQQWCLRTRRDGDRSCRPHLEFDRLLWHDRAGSATHPEAHDSSGDPEEQAHGHPHNPLHRDGLGHRQSELPVGPGPRLHETAFALHPLCPSQPPAPGAEAIVGQFVGAQIGAVPPRRWDPRPPLLLSPASQRPAFWSFGCHPPNASSQTWRSAHR